MSREVSAGLESVLVLDVYDLIIDLRVESIRNEARADTLNLMRSGCALREDRRACGFYGDDLHVRVLRLQVFTDTGDGSARANASDEYVDLAVSVLPDLRAGRGDVSLRVSDVRELARDETVRSLLRELLSLRDGALHALRALGEDKLRAVRFEKRPALNAHCLRHREYDAIASRSGDRRETDAGIAAGRLDNDGSGLQKTLRLGVIDHRARDTVLDASRRIKILELCENGRAELLFGDEMVQLEQGCMTYEISNSFVNFHFYDSLCALYNLVFLCAL